MQSSRSDQSYRITADFTLHDGSATGGYTLHDFTIGRIANNSVCSTNYSQTHTRSDKEITQDYADIMVYKSSLNTIINKDNLLTNIHMLENLYIHKSK